jgi:hypothetical protein
MKASLLETSSNFFCVGVDAGPLLTVLRPQNAANKHSVRPSHAFYKENIAVLAIETITHLHEKEIEHCFVTVWHLVWLAHSVCHSVGRSVQNSPLIEGWLVGQDRFMKDVPRHI